MQTIFDANSLKQKITIEELESQTGRILPSREELVVIDTGFSHPGYVPYGHGYSHAQWTNYPSSFDCDWDKMIDHDGDHDKHDGRHDNGRHVGWERQDRWPETKWGDHRVDSRWTTWPGHVNMNGHDNFYAYNPPGYNPPGYNPPGYNPPGWNMYGSNPPGYNPIGFNPHGSNMGDPVQNWNMNNSYGSRYYGGTYLAPYV